MFGFGVRVPEVNTEQLQAKVEGGEKVTVVDVREPWEFNEGHVQGSVLRPLGQISSWVNELDKDAEIYLICRTGSRSTMACQFLQAQGFDKVYNVSGGIITWRGAVEQPSHQ